MAQIFDTIFDFTSENGVPSIALVIWCIYLGIMIAVVLSLVSRVYSHRLVAALIRSGAQSPDTAKSFGALNLRKNLIYRYIIRKNSPLRKYIKYNGSEMYIPEDRRIGAELRFSEERHPIMTLVFSAIVFFIAASLVIIYLPQFLDVYKTIGKQSSAKTE